LNLALDNYRRSLSESKRVAILKAGRETFLMNGYSGAAVADIARGADVSTATLYKHFVSKEDLFAAVVRDAYGIREGEYENPPQEVDVEDFLVSVLHRYLDAQFGQQINALLRTVIAEVPNAPDLAHDMFEKLITIRYREYESIIERLIERGKLKPHDVRYGVRLISGVVKEYFVWPALFDAECKLPPDTDKILRQVVRDYLALYGAKT